MSNTFFISDIHFGHKNIMKFCPNTRPWETTDEMDAAIISQWQATVGEQDHVWVLGDLFFCNATDAMRIMDQLPGVIHLVYGNHDKTIRHNSQLRDRFASLQDYKELKLLGKDWVLMHYPMVSWNKMHYAAIHCHGHTHGNYTHEGRAVDVGWDGHFGQRLITPQEIVDYTSARPLLGHH